MSRYNKLHIKLLHKLYVNFSSYKEESPSSKIEDPNHASELIRASLKTVEPIMISRFGSTELNCLNNYMGVKHQPRCTWDYIKGARPQYWWNESIINQMKNCAGFYPSDIPMIERFCELMLQDITEVDILGSWLDLEQNFYSYLKGTKIHLRLLEPFWSEIPWTAVLADRKILVVHPFDQLILSQYEKRESLFKNKNVLPTFSALNVVPAVQSIGEPDPRFENWFQALDYMKETIDSFDYDICLIGAGAYGLPLAAHVKRSGKKAIHLGGSLQLLFGIVGRRWEDPNYGVKEWGIPVGSYSKLINSHWVRPGSEYRPKNAEQVEGACYW